MIVRDLNVVHAIVFPDETNPIPVVYADAVLSLPIAAQRLKPVSRKDSQVRQGAGTAKQHQLPQRRPHEIRGEAPGLARLPERLRPGIGEALEHTRDINSSRYECTAFSSSGSGASYGR
jgi:hypothetical protein